MAELAENAGMDQRSSGAMLRILNLMALADGDVSLEESHLLDSLIEQYKLQARMISWESELEHCNDLQVLAALIAPEHRALAMKTATMVAAVSRARHEDAFISPEEDALLLQLASALELAPEEVQQLRDSAEEELNNQPNLWQVLYTCFGGQFNWLAF